LQHWPGGTTSRGIRTTRIARIAIQGRRTLYFLRSFGGCFSLLSVSFQITP
jgi:hypothetical protein